MQLPHARPLPLLHVCAVLRLESVANVCTPAAACGLNTPPVRTGALLKPHAAAGVQTPPTRCDVLCSCQDAPHTSSHAMRSAALPLSHTHMPKHAARCAHLAVFPSAEELHCCLHANSDGHAGQEQQLQDRGRWNLKSGVHTDAVPTGSMTSPHVKPAAVVMWQPIVLS